MVRGKLHLAAVLGLVVAMLASLAMVASAAVTKNAGASAAQYQYKVTICHRTKSKKKPFRTIKVAAAAVPAHVKHGDTVGPCATAAATTKSSGKGKKGKNAGATESGTQGKGQGQGKGSGQSGGNGNGKGKDN